MNVISYLSEGNTKGAINSGIGLIPELGEVNGIKYIDDIEDGTEQIVKHGDEVGDVIKEGDEVGEVAGDVAKGGDEVEGVAKNGEGVDDINAKWKDVSGYEELQDANIEDFDISGKQGKHLEGHSGGYAKFNTSDPQEANKMVVDAVENGEIVDIEYNGKGSEGQESYRVNIETGKQVGTKGETGIRIVYDENGNVWSTFPVNT